MLCVIFLYAVLDSPNSVPVKISCVSILLHHTSIYVPHTLLCGKKITSDYTILQLALKFDPGNSCLSPPPWHGLQGGGGGGLGLSKGGARTFLVSMHFLGSYPCTYRPMCHIHKLFVLCFQSFPITYYIMSKGHIFSYKFYLTYIHDSPNDSFFVSALPG
jgi:hypothetical protein